MRYAPVALAIVVGALAPPAIGASPPTQLVELPGAEALPPVPPLSPPQPPLVEVARLPGTVSAQERVVVGIDAVGTPHRVSVVQRLAIRALGDYAFFIPAPAESVVAAEGSESQPGLRPNQIVWQGFSPRRRVLAADANLRLGGSVAALPLRVAVSGAPVRPGPFELILSLENATGTRVQTLSGDGQESDVVAALEALRAAARIGSAVEGRVVRISGTRRPTMVEASAALALRGAVRFPAGSVRDLTPAQFSRVLGGGKPSMLRITVRGVALRLAAPQLRVVAEPVVDAALPPASARTLDEAITAYLRYARTRQYLTFLANPDPDGPSRTTYVFETAATERPAVGAGPEPSDDSGVPVPVVAAGLALLGLGLVVLWAHS